MEKFWCKIINNLVPSTKLLGRSEWQISWLLFGGNFNNLILNNKIRGYFWLYICKISHDIFFKKCTPKNSWHFNFKSKKVLLFQKCLTIKNLGTSKIKIKMY